MFFSMPQPLDPFGSLTIRLPLSAADADAAVEGTEEREEAAASADTNGRVHIDARTARLRYYASFLESVAADSDRSEAERKSLNGIAASISEVVAEMRSGAQAEDNEGAAAADEFVSEDDAGLDCRWAPIPASTGSLPSLQCCCWNSAFVDLHADAEDARPTTNATTTGGGSRGSRGPSNEASTERARAVKSASGSSVFMLVQEQMARIAHSTWEDALRIQNKAGKPILAVPFSCFPSSIIAGAQKSGTTALFAYMLQHPQFLAPLAKEVHMFDKMSQEPARTYLASMAWFPYLQQLRPQMKGLYGLCQKDMWCNSLATAILCLISLVATIFASSSIAFPCRTKDASNTS
jgi:hypothetical protein